MQDMTAIMGTWRSQGYNQVVEIAETGYRFFDISRISCIETGSGSLEEFAARFDRFAVQKDQFSAYGQWGITRYTWERMDGLPEALIAETLEKMKDPLFNFEVFWQYFQENYAFFNLRNVDWDGVYRAFRPQVTANTSDDRLRAVFSEMIQLLGDPHITLLAGDLYISSAKPDALFRQWLGEFSKSGGFSAAEMLNIYITGFGRLGEHILADFLHGSGKAGANNMVVWGEAAPKIGYLMAAAMNGFAGFEAPISEQFRALNETLDLVIEDFNGMDGVIIDNRFNAGGHDAAALVIARRFTDRQRLAFSKKAKTDQGFTEDQKIYVYPDGPSQFTGPVVLLTSEATVSAAEIFTLAMMSLPHVTRMGENTHGALSDMLPRKLPNGWDISLSNEVYTGGDGNLYEKTGIPAQVEAPVFQSENFYPGLKIGLEKAIEYLKRKV
jgi:carboxyl-terminal processing protease